MKKEIFKKLYPYLIALVVGLLLTLIFFFPELQNKGVFQMDILKHKGMAQDIFKMRESGGNSLWTNRMFGGMPAFQISYLNNENIFSYFNKIFMIGMPRTSGFLFLYFIGYFFLLKSLKKETWIAILGALAFALSTYFIIIIQVGHTSKANAIGYIAPLIAGILMTYRGKYITGGIITAIFAGLEIMANHYQMTYYFLFLIAFLVLGQLVIAYQQKKINQFVKASGIMIIAGILALGPNMSNFISTYKYTEHTTRGTTELTFEKNQSSGTGLDKDYITAWSQGIGETFTLFIPNLKGGETAPISSVNKNALENVDANYKQNIAQMGSYWGEQPFTAGPVYVGAFIFMLFILGIFLVRNWLVWSLLGATILTILLSWGRNFMPLTEFFIDYFPMYNKFRTVASILVVAEFTIPLIAILGLKKIYDEPKILVEKIKYFWISLALTGGLAFIFWLSPKTFFSFITNNELNGFQNYISQGASMSQIDSLIANIEIARIHIFKADAMRSFLFIIFGSGLLWFWSKNKIKKELFIAGLFIVVLADLVPVNKRYLNESHFVAKRKLATPFTASQADSYILSDKEENFRVLNLSVDPFNDSSTSYFHNSIGGYHAAKLKRYQDLITYKLQNEIKNIINTFNNNPNDSAINAVFSSSQGLNMLNTKYLIYNPSSSPLENRYKYGQAWFVNNVIFAQNADEEMVLLNQTDISNTAIVNVEFSDLIPNNKFQTDSNAYIKLIDYSPNKLKYEFYSSNAQFVVFSEIYYPDWEASIDNQKLSVFRTNYVLRGLIIPEGKHIIDFTFEPEQVKTGKIVASIFSILLLLIILSWIGWNIKNYISSKKDIN